MGEPTREQKLMIQHFQMDEYRDWTCVSRVTQFLDPLAERIEREKLSGLCDALCIDFITKTLKRQEFPKTTAAFNPTYIDDLVAAQRKNMVDQREGAKSTLTELGLSWINAESHRLRGLRGNHKAVNGMTSKETFSRLIGNNREHFDGVMKSFQADGVEVSPAWLFAMFYFRRASGGGNHNCCAIISPAGRIDFFDPNLGVFRFDAGRQNLDRAASDCGEAVEFAAKYLRYGEQLDSLFFVDKVSLFGYQGFSQAMHMLA